MSVLQVYLSWANSVLGEANRAVDSVGAVQDGKILCELIDILAPDAGLMAKIQASGTSSQRTYIQTALDHMMSHGIKISFSAQDIIDGDIKSLLDVMWLLILNYGIHFIGQDVYQRSVGTGKKNLLEWCQGELEVAFDHRNTLAFNLCTGNWFTKLLQKFAGLHIPEVEDKVSYLYKLLEEIEQRFGIRRTIISPNDIIDGTVDEHTLMIYLSLLKRRVCNTARSARREMLSVDGKEAALARIQERNRSLSAEAEARRRLSELVPTQDRETRPARSASLDSSLSPQGARASMPVRSQDSVEEGSDWFSSSNGSLVSGKERGSSAERGNTLQAEAEQVLLQTISEKVKEHIPISDRDEDKDTDASHSHSERETETLSEFSSSALDEGYISQRKDYSRSKKSSSKDSWKPKEQTSVKRSAEKGNSNGKMKSTAESGDAGEDKTVKIKIKRPTDYYLQWEETIDRLSHGPLPPPDVSDMSPRSPREILGGIHGISGLQGNRSRSLSQDSESDLYGRAELSVWRRREYFERRSGSASPSSMQRKRGRGSGGGRSLSWDYPLSSDFGRHVGEQRERVSNGSQQMTVNGYSVESRRPEPLRESSEDGHGPQSITADWSHRREVQPPSGEGHSQAYGNLLERLEELGRSGRAQRVILPDLGPEAPVLMIPGQGQEVLLLFDALRRARLEVDLNMPKANGHAQTPSQPSEPQQMTGEEETDLKKNAERNETNGRVHESTPAASRDGAVNLPRPTPYQRQAPKLAAMRVSDLRAGRGRDERRAQSFTQSKQAVSPLVTSSADSSLSPQREVGPGHSQSQSDRLSPSRNGTPLRNAGNQSSCRPADAAPASQSYTAGRNTVSSAAPRSYETSPVGLRNTSSPSTSPYRQNLPKPHLGYHSLSPLRPLSPRSSLSPVRPHSPRSGPRIGQTSERLPRLNLSEDNDSTILRMGGLGRVPRREAWERQRKDTSSFDTSNVDSLAQAKFIEILCKEIEELKHKIEDMEDSQAESSPERRASPVRRHVPLENRFTSSRTGENELSKSYSIRSEIQETDNKMLLARRDGSLSPHRPSPKRWHGLTASRSQSSSPTPQRSPVSHSSTTLTSTQSGQSQTSFSRIKGRQSPSPERVSNLSARKRVDTHLSDSLLTQSSDLATASGTPTATLANVSGSVSPVRSGRAISLGYKSPIRSVTQEIWGKDLTNVEGLEPGRHDRYRRLISLRNVSEEDVIELKQALASAVVENDILQAKLNNARHEIQSKLGKTNEVLGDCRRHLAKSQAENMELRTALERERDRTATLEGRAREMDVVIQHARADNEELEEELDHTLSMLDRSISETKPGIDALKQQNAQLRGQATVIQTENSSLKREMDELRKSHTKAVHTIRELRSCLDEAREERDDLQQQVNKLERSQTESRLQSILTHYQEKGSVDETEREYNSSGLSLSSDRFPRNHRRTSTRNDEVTPTTPSKAASPNVSGITPPGSSPAHGLNYSFEEVSIPVIPSTYREIYPHRKPRYQSMSAERYSGTDSPESPVNFVDYPDLQTSPMKLGPVELGDSHLSHSQQQQGQGVYDRIGQPKSRDSSPIRKPIPSYRPFRGEASSYTVLSERSTEVLGSARSSSPQTRGRSPVRLSHSMREIRSSSQSPRRGLSGDTLNKSYDSVFDRNRIRSASTSPSRYSEGRRGILKNGISASDRLHDRSSSPRYGSRSHSPPTRLSPENKKDKLASKKKLMFTKTEAGEIARNLQREFDKEDSMLDKLRQKHSTKSWFELQLDNEDRPSGVALAEQLEQDPVLLSEDQRSYANKLIKKYTGMNV